MGMVLQLFLLVVGFIFLVKGADWFVDGAAGIANRFGIPQLVIGLTIVALGTSAPEAAVSITAAAKGSADITIGNIVGSNILNVLVILGLSALVYPLSVAKSSIRVDIPLTIGITVLLYLLGMNGTISRVDGVILLLIFAAYMAFLFWSAKKERSSQQSLLQDEILDDLGDSKKVEGKKTSVVMLLLFTIIGLGLIVGGSDIVVRSATNIARALGWSERFIGLTIVALGTSLPELFTSVAAAAKKNCDIAVGNIIGSNIFNILFVVGLSSLIIPVPFAVEFRFDTIISGVAVVLLFLFCLPKKQLSRWAGGVMLASYVAYFLWIL